MPEDFDEKTVMIIAGVPCGPEEQRAIGIDSMKPLDGSVRRPCFVCSTDVNIGPKQLAKSKELGGQGFKPTFMCFACAAMYQTMAGIPLDKTEVRACGDESAEYKFTDGNGPKF